MTTFPLVPLLVLPVENERDPEPPLSPASAVRILNAPLDVARPKPETIDTAPAVATVDSPAWTVKRPPTALVPWPTTTLILPAIPSDMADPVRRVIIPLLPSSTALPVENASAPVTPAVPPIAVLILNDPLDVAVP
jgi:hypothetical protein